MKLIIRMLPLAVAQLLVITIYANDSKPKIAVQPAWATSTIIDYNSTQLDAEADDGIADLLFDRQISIAMQTSYTKKAFRVLSEAGVQNNSQVSIDYDPSYQQLFFHSIRIVRGSESINQLHLSKIRTIQQEKELDRFIYDGTISALLILPDVRKNDIIEYSYSVKGFNPIFKNKYSTILEIQFSVPVYQLYYKIVSPATRDLSIKNNLTDSKPVITSVKNETVYEWKFSNAAAFHAEDNVPSWYDPYPSIMISEYKNWKEVSDWAMELFASPTTLSPLLQKKVMEIKSAYATPTEQTLAALRFVQDDIRYMGIEMGQNSHKPHNPIQILKQRFGDCKDKAYLLCTLLKALGVEAYPVLINTMAKKSLNTFLPSPKVFDHTTVVALLNNKPYYFDATISYQRGELEAISFPDYQKGLWVSPATKDLTTIALQNKGRVVTKEIFNVADMEGNARLEVVTKFTGSFADNVRSDFKKSSHHELVKFYREYYTYDFKNISSDSLASIDDEATGAFTTKEYYTITNFWERENDKNKVLIQPYLLNSVFKKPKDNKRSMPYSLPFPARYEEEIELNLPQRWEIDADKSKFQGPAFKLDYSYSLPEDKRILLHYSFENLTDHVSPEEVANYVKEMTKADKSLAFEVSLEGATHGSTALNNYQSGNVYTGLYVLLGICALATYFFRRKNRMNNY